VPYSALCQSFGRQLRDTLELLIAVKLDLSAGVLEVTSTLQVSSIRKLPDFPSPSLLLLMSERHLSIKTAWHGQFVACLSKA